MMVKRSVVIAVALIYCAFLMVKGNKAEVDISKKEDNFCPNCRARAPAFLGKRSGFPVQMVGEVTPVRVVPKSLHNILGQLSRAEWDESNQFYQPKQYLIEA